MKVLLLSNQGKSMSIFWRVLIRSMLARKCEVICCVPYGDPESEQRLQETGATVINYNLDRKGLNPLADLRTLAQLTGIFNKHKPDYLFATTIKPVIYGCLAARHADVTNIFATITGLGYAFEADTPFKRLVNRVSRFLYRISLSRTTGIFFQNRDDERLFHEQGILQKTAPVFLVHGTGVDTRHFAPAPLPGTDQPITFLLIGRLLKAKGLEDFAQAARIVHASCPRARFRILGPQEQGLGSLAPEVVRSWATDVEWLGEATDVRPWIRQAHVVVLPSWREGVPTALMEAMSMGRPCIATDVPGCREVVRDGQNGFLVAPRNAPALADACLKFLNNPELLPKMAAEGRKLAETEFDANMVAAGILKNMGISGE